MKYALALAAVMALSFGCKTIAQEVRTATEGQVDPQSFYLGYGHEEHDGKISGAQGRHRDPASSRTSGNTDRFDFGVTFSLEGE